MDTGRYLTRADLFRLEARVFRTAATVVAEYGHGAVALLHRMAGACDERAATTDATDATDTTGCPHCGHPNPQPQTR